MELSTLDIVSIGGCVMVAILWIIAWLTKDYWTWAIICPGRSLIDEKPTEKIPKKQSKNASYNRIKKNFSSFHKQDRTSG